MSARGDAACMDKIPTCRPLLFRFRGREKTREGLRSEPALRKITFKENQTMAPHTIAVAGKGGVGKTTTCGMIIDYL